MDGNYVERGEFLRSIELIENRMEVRFSEISEKLDRRITGSRQVWLGVASILVTFLGMGAALVAFSLDAAVSPVEVETAAVQQRLVDAKTSIQQSIDQLPSRSDVTAVRAEMDLIKTLIVRDIRIDHQGGGGEAAAAVRFETLMEEQSKLWQLIETLDLKIQRLEREGASQ